MSGRFGMEHIYAPGAPDDGSDEYVIAKYNSADSRDKETYVYSLDQIEESRLDQNGSLRDKAADGDDTQHMSQSNDYRHELSLRDEQLRREMDLRQESFRAEQAARDAAWSERFSGFLSTQAEHDKVIDAKLDSITVKVDGVAANVGSFEAKIDHALTNVRKSNWATLGGLITVGVAIVLGVWAVNSTIISSASSIFTAGQESNKSQQASEQILKDTQDLLRQLKQPADPTAPTPLK